MGTFVLTLKRSATILRYPHEKILLLSATEFEISTKTRSTRTCMAGSPPSKKFCSTMKIGTHNGSFHCDEILACFMLKLLPKFKDAEIVRSRDTNVLNECDIVVDVGGIYDPEKNRFDHHQRSFQDSMSTVVPGKKWTTRLSSAGLIYAHFGKMVLEKILDLPQNHPVLEIVYDKVYENFLEEVDAVDNGINQYDGNARYHVTTTIGSRVKNLNPGWNETSDEMECFMKAYSMVGSEFLDRILYYKQSWIPARELVDKAINSRKEVDPSGEIIVLPSGGCPWKDHLFNIEEEERITPPIKYCLFTDQSGNWRIQCVPLKASSFDNRLSLPEPWRGIRDQELSDLTNIPGCIFVHASGFIGGAKTFEAVLKMAQISLQQQKDQSS